VYLNSPSLLKGIEDLEEGETKHLAIGDSLSQCPAYYKDGLD